MTRFIMYIDRAAEFVLDAREQMEGARFSS
jgi:FlaA1/EpsC-like NDP-sugar epimerase